MGSGLGFPTLDEIDVSGKAVLVRVDINSPLDPKTKVIMDDARIREHAETVRELASKKARVIVLGHQGRRGDPDFSSLEQHSRVLSKILGVNVRFVPDVVGEEAVSAIRGLRPGEVLMLDNVRGLEEEAVERSAEEHAGSRLVETLAPLADYFVNDAFSAAHRSHASIVGFTRVLPSAAGRVMERELRALARVFEAPEKPCVYIIGGAKPKGSLEIVENVLSRGVVDDILTGGLMAQAVLSAKGFKLGEANERALEERGFKPVVERAGRVLQRFGDRVLTPIDVAVDLGGRRVEVRVDDLPSEGLIKDVGAKTAELYARLVRRARSVVMSGPMGVFEEEQFSRGTRDVLRALSEVRGFTLVGGGHTLAAVHKFGLEKRMSHVSTAGGALIEFLSGNKLPGVEALRASKRCTAGLAPPR